MTTTAHVTLPNDDDQAWEDVLSDPENQKTLSELSEAIKERAAQGAYGVAVLESKESPEKDI